MTKPRMNVQTIAEILTEELGKIEKHTAKFQEASSKVEQATERLLTTEVKVDIKELKQVENNLTRTFTEHIQLPKWTAKAVLYTLVVCFVLTLISCLLTGYYYNEMKKSKEESSYWYGEYKKIKPKN